MPDVDIIPAEQLKRLDVQTSASGEVTSARTPPTLLEWIAEQEYLPYRAVDYHNAVTRMRVAELGQAVTSAFGRVGGDTADSYYSRMILELGFDKVRLFLMVGEIDACLKHRVEIMRVMGELREAYRDIEKFLDSMIEQ